MTTDQVKILAKTGTFNAQELDGKVIETHISWVILSGDNAFKIKKPLKLDFLDFSTLTRRKRLCQREVALNLRLTDIYLGVLPVRMCRKKYSLGDDNGRVVDFAVHLKRVPQSRQMDKMIKHGVLRSEHVRAVGEMIASFHSRAVVVRSPFILSKARTLFNDLASAHSVVQNQIGNKYTAIIARSIAWSDAFLQAHAKQLQDRVARGFKRDVHGDLHCGNIFIHHKPIIFDCIEFNDEFRQIDVLYELAFLLMDRRP